MSRAVLGPLSPGPGFLSDPAWGRSDTDRGRMAPTALLLWVSVEGELVAVPSGYAINGASIPRVLWSFGHPFEPWVLRSAGVHDWLCDTRHPRGSGWVHEQFARGLQIDATSRWERVRARAYARAVRLCGPRWPARV